MSPSQDKHTSEGQFPILKTVLKVPLNPVSFKLSNSRMYPNIEILIMLKSLICSYQTIRGILKRAMNKNNEIIFDNR